MQIYIKYDRTIKKEYLDIGMEYMIKAMKRVTTKYGKKIVISFSLTTNFPYKPNTYLYFYSQLGLWE